MTLKTKVKTRSDVLLLTNTGTPVGRCFIEEQKTSMRFQNFSVIPMSSSQPKFMSTMTLKPCVPTYLLLILRYMCRQSVVKGFFPYLIRKRKHPTNRIIKAFVGCLSGWAGLAALIPFANSCLLWCGPENGQMSILHTFLSSFFRFESL